MDSRLRRLREEYGSFPVDGRTVQNSPNFFEHGRRFIQAGHVGAAGALIRADGGVLLAYHAQTETWGPPGGGHEPGERLEETARREVREETNVECDIVGVFHAERKRFVNRADPEQRGYLLEVVFEAEYVSGVPDASDDDEILEAHWFDSPPVSVDDIVAAGSGVWEDGRTGV